MMTSRALVRIQQACKLHRIATEIFAVADRSTIGCSQQRNRCTVYLLQLRAFIVPDQNRSTANWLQPAQDHYLLALGVIYLVSCCGQDRSTVCCSQHKNTSQLVVAETSPPFTAVANTDHDWQWLCRCIINSTVFAVPNQVVCTENLLASKTSHGQPPSLPINGLQKKRSQPQHIQ